MTAFWIAAGLLTALILAVLCWPLLRRTSAAHASRQAINTAIYRDQMAELERDLASGALSQTDYASARDELERRVLEDVAVADAPAATAPRRLPRTALGLAVAMPLCAVALYFVLGTPAALDPAAQRGVEPTAADVEKMVAALAAKLEQNPDNPEGWVMLGRSYKVLGRFPEAAKAFERAGAAMDSSPELILEQADLSAELNNGRVEGKSRDLLMQLLQDQPDNPQALVLAGFDAFSRQRYGDAVTHWEKLLAMVPPDSQDAKNLAAGIDKARSMMGDKGAAKPKPVAAAPTAAASRISGRVELARELKAKAAPDDVVFIFARAVSGPRMPLAIVRAKVSDLPMDFSLDDSMAMSPDFKISSVGEVRVEARVSKSGDAKAKPGDMTGESAPVKPGTSGLTLRIGQVVQ